MSIPIFPIQGGGNFMTSWALKKGAFAWADCFAPFFHTF
ncbi:hypothetical protein BGS_0637 [Beggiatoa sp. SS]|nr:hypothetical protein BGS_0637 [Beggiatoa sp. SS]